MRRTRALSLLSAIGVIAGVSAALAATPAWACDTLPGHTCHGAISWTPQFNSLTGGLATLNASRLSVPNGANDFVNHEMWVATNNSDGNGPNPFVEIGLKYGYHTPGTNLGLVLFWAEYNTNLSVGWHQIQMASLNTNYAVKISYSGSNSWGVYLGGVSQGGTSNFQPCCVGHLQVGGETTTSGAQVTASGSGLQKRASDNVTWSYGWGGGPYTDGTGNPFSVTWLTNPTSMQETAN